MTEESKSFTVGQLVKITGGKHSKTIDDENEKCLITSIKSTFCEVTIFKRNDPDDPGNKIQCHRKFIEGVGQQLTPDIITEGVEKVLAGGDPKVFSMPDLDDCIAVTKETFDGISAEVEEVDSDYEDRNDPIIEDVDRDGMLRARIAELESDLASYRDMMLGNQNELNFLRSQNAPTEEERKGRNEKIIKCINLLCSLQV